MGEIERGLANVTVRALDRIADVLDWDPWARPSGTDASALERVCRLGVSELHKAPHFKRAILE